MTVLVFTGGYRCGVGLFLMTIQVAAFSQSTAGGSALQLPHLAQFQAPGVREGTRPERPERPELPSELRFSYAYGSDSEFTYRRNADLDKRIGDSSQLFAPTVFGFLDYRPTAWLASRLEVTVEAPIDVKKQSPTPLPTGEILLPEKRRTSIIIDQAYATIKNPGATREFTLGRRNFEDPRLWLYDAALDAAIVKLTLGYLETEASVSRENLVDGDLLNGVPKTRVNNYIIYTDYRGIEDHRLAAYWIKRDDKTHVEGRPLLMGVRAYGTPSDRGNYWADFSIARGRDEAQRRLRGTAFDVGFTYRYLGAPLSPSFTMGYAAGSGDTNPNDNVKNTEYRQSGLQSNETRFGGLTQFKRYGEVLDPELSNVEILTAGVGFRLAPTVFVDVVYHRYRMKVIADQIRNWALTAQMNQDDTSLSRDVGKEVDIIVGWRNLFGVKRLGFEVRAGGFSPGRAFRNEVSDAGAFRPADKAVSLLAVIIY